MRDYDRYEDRLGRHFRWRLRFEDGRRFSFRRLSGLLSYARRHGHPIRRSAPWTYRVT